MALDDLDIAFIGAGNMAAALIEGLITSNTCKAARIAASDPDSARLQALAKRLGIRAAPSNSDAAQTAAVVVLATKPQVFDSVLPELAGQLRRDAVVLSIAAGVPIEVIERQLGAGVRVVRAMPNTPALVRAGATALAAGNEASDADMQTAEQIFAAVGITVRVEEALMDVVTGLSGSGPAYLFAMVEALGLAGARCGLPAHTAKALARQTVIGAAKLLEQSGEPPETLRARVTSPGGTTQAGLQRLAERNFADTVADAVARAADRGRELADAARKAGDR